MISETSDNLFAPTLNNPLHVFSHPGVVGDKNVERKSCLKKTVTETQRDSNSLFAKPKVRWASPISQFKSIPARSSSQEQFHNNDTPIQYPAEFSSHDSPSSYLAFTNYRTHYADSTNSINSQSQSFDRVLLFQHAAPKPPPSFQYSVLVQNNLRHLGYAFHYLPPPDTQNAQTLPCIPIANSQVTIVQGDHAGIGQREGEEDDDITENTREASSEPSDDSTSTIDRPGPSTAKAKRKRDRIRNRHPLVNRPKVTVVTLPIATQWASELGTYEYLIRTHKVSAESAARLNNLLDRIDMQKAKVSESILRMTKLAKKMRMFAHRTAFGADSQRKARQLLDFWAVRFVGKPLTATGAADGAGSSGVNSE